jgi:flagellar motility protein MotE (MotC chaperone)
MRLPMRHVVAVIVSALTISALAPPAAATEAEDWQAVQNAENQGRIHQDPERRALRQAVLNAANRVDASPCDTQQRQKLSDAFDTYQHHMQATAEDKIETWTLQDGRVLDLTQHFNNPVEDTWRFALTSICQN